MFLHVLNSGMWFMWYYMFSHLITPLSLIQSADFISDEVILYSVRHWNIHTQKNLVNFCIFTLFLFIFSSVGLSDKIIMYFQSSVLLIITWDFNKKINKMVSCWDENTNSSRRRIHTEFLFFFLCGSLCFNYSHQPVHRQHVWLPRQPGRSSGSLLWLPRKQASPSRISPSHTHTHTHTHTELSLQQQPRFHLAQFSR